MPRVLQVVLSLNPGGTERLVVELVRRLHGEVPTAVCCLDELGAWGHELRSDGIEVNALHRRPGFRPGLGRQIAALARSHRASLVHAHHYSPFVYSALAKVLRPQLQVVFTEHGRLSDAGPSRKRRQANRVLRRLADAVFAVSQDVRSHLVAEGFHANRVGVIYNGIDPGSPPDPRLRLALRKELGLTDADVVVGTVARLDPVKNLTSLVEAVGLLSETSRPPTLVVVGEGAERPNLEALVARLDIAHRVRFLGYRDDVRRVLTACDLYVNSSTSEGVSLTILEAMATGLPVVATAVGGTPEVVTPDCGELVPTRNAQALAEGLHKLGLDAERRQALGSAARARVKTHFALDRMVADYRRIYEQRAHDA